MTRLTKEERVKNEIFNGLEDLVQEMNLNVDATIVEGPHDKKTLRMLGYEKPIVWCSKTPHNNLPDLIAKRFSSVVILTDFDKEGLYLNKKLTTLLENRGVKVNKFYRNKIQRMLRRINIFTIEGIYNIKKSIYF